FLTRAQSVYSGFVSYQDNMNETITSMVTEINRIGERIREINESIAGIESGKQEKANDLRDERNKLLDQLGEYGRIDYEEDRLGNVQVLFEGSSFVSLGHVNHIGIDTTLVSPVGYATPYWEYAAKTEINKSGEKVVVSIDGGKLFDLTQAVSSSTNTDIGKLKAVLLARGDHNATYHDITEDENYYNDNIAQSVIMNVEAEFDQMIHIIMTKINDVLEAAESNPAFLDNMAGLPSDFSLFNVSNTEDTVNYDFNDKKKAGTILTGFTIMNSEVNPILVHDPTVFTFRTIEGNEDNATTTELKKAFTSEEYVINPNVATRNNFITYYNSLVSQVANTGDVFNSISKAQEETVSAVDAAREQITGVSSDEELEYMIMFQNAYNASSRFINVVSEMLEHLVTTLGS
ncbi:MAG: hypothetical protein J5959_14035, partial [Butyrivibrio sp.]|nr:hypothetical protein [Butyrivibrio sp.]